MIVISDVLVRVFHLGSWGGPLLFREPAELQSPREASTPQAQLPLQLHIVIVMAYGSNCISSVIDTAPHGRGCGSICRGGRVICPQFGLLSVGGDTLLESDSPGVWVGTPVSTDCSIGVARWSPLYGPPHRQPFPRTHDRVS